MLQLPAYPLFLQQNCLPVTLPHLQPTMPGSNQHPPIPPSHQDPTLPVSLQQPPIPVFHQKLPMPFSHQQHSFVDTIQGQNITLLSSNEKQLPQYTEPNTKKVVSNNSNSSASTPFQLTTIMEFLAKHPPQIFHQNC